MGRLTDAFRRLAGRGLPPGPEPAYMTYEDALKIMRATMPPPPAGIKVVDWVNKVEVYWPNWLEYRNYLRSRYYGVESKRIGFKDVPGVEYSGRVVDETSIKPMTVGTGVATQVDSFRLPASSPQTTLGAGVAIRAYSGAPRKP